MRGAARLAEAAMQTAWDGARAGVRQCDLMAEVVATQIRGTPQHGGDMPALHPLILAGEAATTAHPLWTDAPLEAGQTIAFELGACLRRYNVGLARTVHIGEPSDELQRTAAAVEEGMARDGCAEGRRRCRRCSCGVAGCSRPLRSREAEPDRLFDAGYAPDWGEHTLSFRSGVTTIVPEDAVVHVILGMWMDDWGMELSETLHVRRNDCVRLCDFRRMFTCSGMTAVAHPRREAAISLLADLVGFPSVSLRPNGPIVTHIESYLKAQRHLLA